MTTETDFSSGASGESRQPGRKSPARTSRPPEIRMNMPNRNPGSPDRSGAGAGGEPQESIENLLLKLIARLDENDRHYGQALDNLNDRLNALSQRAHSASTSSPAGSTAALDRVHQRASSLAAQVNDAGAAHRAQQSTPLSEIEHRLRTFTNPLEGAFPPGENIAVNDDFADVTERLERSLAAGAPATEFETLTNRMDDLARNLDAALESRNDPGTLQSIEARLEELARSFADTQQNYARIEDIEGHLLSLMKWTQSANAPVNDGKMYARLDAIERALQALNDNSREMDDHTRGTLEALNEAVDSPASRVGSSRRPGAAYEESPVEPGETGLRQAARAQYATEDYADVWIDDGQEANAQSEPPTSRSRPAPASNELGASIPDYQPEPAASVESHRPEPGGRKAGRSAGLQDRVEPADEAVDDFIASARRAAAAASAQAPEPSSAGSRAGYARPFPSEAAEPAPSGSKRPRPIFLAAAFGLLLLSAGILFGQLTNKPEAPAAGPIQLEAPRPPAPAPKAPEADSNRRSSLPAADTGDEKLHSGRMAPGQGQPASAKRAAPAATPSTALATRANYRPSTPARDSLPALLPQQPVSTATLLASLSPEAARGPLPGVQVTIKEPSEHTPALVPPAASAPRPDPLAPPKRAPAAGVTSKPAKKLAIPAGGVSQPMPSRTAAMPPARIGPQSLRMAAARGNPAAQVEVASRFAKGAGVAKNLKKAAKWYGRAAAQGFAPAQYRLAALHERGLGVKKDIALARTWYRRAAELGNIRAMHNLAVLHTRAKPDSRPDYTAAKNWFHEAARHGLADSQFNMGILYESGLGVRKNAAEAYKWFTLAARQGDEEARKRRETIRPKLPARSLAGVEKTLRLWKPAKAKAAANKTGQPPGGWHNAKLPKAANATSPALVTRAQKLLNKLGYNAGLPDGKLGPRTITAIRRFENRTGAPESGRVTPTLLRQLDALSG